MSYSFVISFGDLEHANFLILLVPSLHRASHKLCEHKSYSAAMFLIFRLGVLLLTTECDLPDIDRVVNYRA